MFLATDHSTQVASDLPRSCSFAESDWHILAGFWHPVAFAHDIKDKPVAAKLLDVDLVIFRTEKGISVARDLCMHRGTRISGGWMCDDHLVCPMHGLQYDGEGYCRKIPSIENPNAKIPKKLRLQIYQSTERYGIVWACLKNEPIWGLPHWKHLDDPQYKPVYIPAGNWHAAASRHVENFNDVAHFSWVHKNTFGGEESAPVPVYHVHHADYGLSFELPYMELGNRFPDGRDDLENREVIYRYELTFPFSSLLEVDVQDSDFVHYIADTICPISAQVSGIFQIMTDNSGNPDEDYWIKDALSINDEDRPVVESQSPGELPLDLREEVHIPADRMSIEYRRALANKFGLGAPITS